MSSHYPEHHDNHVRCSYLSCVFFLLFACMLTQIGWWRTCMLYITSLWGFHLLTHLRASISEESLIIDHIQEYNHQPESALSFISTMNSQENRPHSGAKLHFCQDEATWSQG